MPNVTFLPTVMMNRSSLDGIATAQRQLAGAQQELGSGRKADLSRSLGAAVEDLSAMQRLVSESEATRSANARVLLRLDASQSALAAIAGSAQDMLSAMAAGSAAHPTVLAGQASAGMAALIDQLSTTVDGVYIFSGERADMPPVRPDALDRFPAVFESAFTSRFGFPPGDPQTSSITASQIKDFIAGDVAALFKSNAWQDTWSSASATPLRDRISSSRVDATSVTANERAFQKIAGAFAVVTELGAVGLSGDARDAMLRSAMTTLSEGIGETASLQGGLGQVQSDVRDADEQLSARAATLTARIDELSGVDMADVSARISNLLSRIEASYAVTARMQRLSLLDALR